MRREQSRQIDVHELVPVQCEDVAGLAASCRRKADSAAATERLALTDRDNLRPDPAERRLEELLPAARAADEHSVDPRRSVWAASSSMSAICSMVFASLVRHLFSQVISQ